jgi:dTDP-4-dehydrorhamnose 3,5-epimerase
MFNGVEVKELKPLTDNRGFLMEILRGSDKIKEGGSAAFGQYYLMTVNPGVIKGKHFHKLQIDHMTAIKGHAVLHLEDGREGSPTKGQKEKIVFGEGAWKLVKIPPGVWHSVENTGTDVVYIINYVTREYDHKDPDEYRAEFDIDDRTTLWKPSVTG